MEVLNEKMEVTGKRKLDNYVLMAETSNAVSDEFCHPDDQRALGIKIAKLTDILLRP